MKEVIYLELVRRWAYWLLALAALVALPGLWKTGETSSFPVLPGGTESARIETSGPSVVRAGNSGGRELRDRIEPAHSHPGIPPLSGGALAGASSRSEVHLGFDPGGPAAPRTLAGKAVVATL